MAIKHHPDISTLMTCAAGSQPEVLCAVVASHLSYCPACLNKVGRLSRVGVALFDRLEPAPLSLAMPGDIVAGPSLPPKSELSWTDHGDDIPGPLTCMLGQSLDDLTWDEMAPGIEKFKVELSPGAIGDLRLFHVAHGARLRWKNRTGEQLVMLLRGSCSSSKGTFEPGDFEEFEEPGDYGVLANAESGCILLLASESEPQFLVNSAPTTKPQ